jgi:hypothetical protein
VETTDAAYRAETYLPFAAVRGAEGALCPRTPPA